MKTVTPAEFHQILARQPGAAVLDVRTPVEFAEVHIPAARNEPLDQFDPRALLEWGAIWADQPVYLICRSGARAAKAAEKLAKEKIDQGVVVEGGILAWIDAGFPVQRSAVKVISLERQVRIVAGTLVLAGVLLAYFVHPYFIGLSAFVGAGLVFAGISDWCGMGLLLAKLPWNSRKPG
jgi:rhodanese-related sulfurtransferase